MNSVSVTGTLVRDPEPKGGDQRKICQMRIAESGGRKDSPLYINVAAFGRQAETCQEFLSKGRHVAIVGQLRFREWQAEDGSRRAEHSIAADRVDFLPSGSKGRGKGGGRAGAPQRRPQEVAQDGYGGGGPGGSEESADAYGAAEGGGF